MLRRLSIENIAVIEQAELEFRGGLSVLSGETGAGKSIIIDALSAILGGRVSRELIRTGESRACVTALFDGLGPGVREAADRLGLEPEEELLLRREIYADGRNVCRINGQTATLSMLKALGEQLVSIYGQHDGLHLMNEQLHIDYLDAFGGIEGQLEAYRREYEALLHLNRQRKALRLSAAEKERRRWELPRQIDQLEKASVRPGEQDELLALRDQLRNGEKIAGGLREAALLLDGEEGREGAAPQLAQAVKALARSARYSAAAEGLEKRTRELAALAEELSAELSRQLGQMDCAPQRLEETEARLDQISRLCVSLGVPADELEEHLAALRAELHALEHMDDNLDRLNETYARQRAVVYEAAGELHALRQEAARQLAGRIHEELAQLDLKSARFAAEIEDMRTEGQARFTKKGTDQVRFLLSANAGEDLKPLSRVASGGELSRIMLAMKNVLSAGETGMTSVFDEVDAGVSGRAASRVGEKLYAIGRGRQVLCVTHLPQIACLADQQYAITKFSREGRTFTQAELLDREGRIREIARMNAGLHVTQAALAGAGELLRQAEEDKRRLEKA